MMAVVLWRDRKVAFADLLPEEGASADAAGKIAGDEPGEEEATSASDEATAEQLVSDAEVAGEQEEKEPAGSSSDPADADADASGGATPGDGDAEEEDEIPRSGDADRSRSKEPAES